MKLSITRSRMASTTAAHLGVREGLVQAGGRQPDLAVGVDPIEPGGGE